MTGANQNSKMVPVFITELEMPLYLAFKKHHQEFMILCNAGVFDVEFGKVMINKHEGHIQSVHIEQRTYQYVPPGVINR